jgi:drug/metabolite transporter (DMT)-like permease
MPPGVFVLVLFVAVLHVVWNTVLKTSGDTLRTANRAMIVGVAAFAPFVIVAWLLNGRPGMPGDIVFLAVVSGLLEAAYFICLSAAYQRGDLSVVYPIARGTAPILSVFLGLVVLGERLAPTGVLGVAALLLGILLVQRPWRAIAVLRGRAARRDAGIAGAGPGAAEYALLTGVMIAGYSAVDRYAVQSVAPWLYPGIVFPVCAVALFAWVRLVADPRRDAARRRIAAMSAASSDATDAGSIATGPLAASVEGPGGPAPWKRAGAAGIMSVGAYALILVAYTLAPLTAVAPLRESSVVIASAWGAIRMREAVGAADRARRIGGACLVLVGAVLLALEG